MLLPARLAGRTARQQLRRLRRLQQPQQPRCRCSCSSSGGGPPAGPAAGAAAAAAPLLEVRTLRVAEVPTGWRDERQEHPAHINLAVNDVHVKHEQVCSVHGGEAVGSRQGTRHVGGMQVHGSAADGRRVGGGVCACSAGQHLPNEAVAVFAERTARCSCPTPISSRTGGPSHCRHR